MSESQNVEDIPAENEQLLRGEVLLVAFVKKALDGKEQGKTRDYDTLVQKLEASSNNAMFMRKYLSALRNSISHLTKEFDILVGTVLSLSWSDKDRETVEEFIDFIINLVSSQTCYLHACLQMLIKHFLPIETKDLTSDNVDISEKHEKRFANTHLALQAVLEIVPTAPPYLLQIIRKKFPYMRKALEHQECYTKNLLELAKYEPSIQEDILEIICSHILKIDVEIPKNIFEKVQDDGTQFDVELETEETADNKKLLDQTGETNAENELVTILDVLMVLMFKYIKTICYDNGIYNVDGASDLFDKVMKVFFKVIFPTHQSTHVQFLIFYICSFDEIFVDTFLELCWSKFQDPNTPTILRQTATAYIASIVARATYITQSVVNTSLKLLVTWLHSYIDEFDSSCRRCDVNIHGHFYSLCQAVFYIFVFCYPALLDEENGITFVRQLNFERIVTCHLNPLKVCLPTVVQMFAVITRMREIVLCYTIIEKNKRSTLPVSSSTFTSTIAKVSLLNQLDSFFPFDPYLLTRSRDFIKDIYREWQGFDQNNEESHSEDDDTHVEEFVEYSAEATTKSLFLNSYDDQMCISPGFS